VIAAAITSKLQAFKRRHPHPSLFYRASHLATGQVAANDTGLNSQNYDHATCQDGDGLLPTTATSAAPIVTIICDGSERQTMYVTDAEVVLPLSRDEEEPKLCKKILLFGGFIFLLVVVFVFGIVFNLQTEPIPPLSSLLTTKTTEYLDLGTIKSYCVSGLDDDIGKFELPEDCWRYCAFKYPDSLVAIIFDSGYCSCQDSCDCMEKDEDEHVVYILKNMTYPLDCSSIIIPEYLDLGTINSYCKNDLDDDIGRFELPEECWRHCAFKYPDSLVSIGFISEEVCYCQDSCDCMVNAYDYEHVVYILKNMTYPLDCSPKYCPNISATISSPTASTMGMQLRLPSLLPAASPSTSIGWDHFVAIHSCYSTFDDAVKYCNSMGRELAQIYSEEENKKAMEACGDNSCWIGLIEIGGDESTPKSSQSWKWLNGREVVYTNWDSYQPSNWEGKDERYGNIFKNGKWNDVDGSYNLIPLCSLSVY